MSMLLDTNVLLRLVTDNPHIGESFKQAVESGLDNGDVAVSARDIHGDDPATSSQTDRSRLPPGNLASRTSDVWTAGDTH